MRAHATKGDATSVPAAWRWLLALLLYIPATALILLISALVFVADLMLFDTHHFVFKVTPKAKE